MGVLRGIGYFIASLILIGGIILFFIFPPAGIGPIVAAIIIMYVLHKGAQVKTIRDDIRKIRKLQEESARRDAVAKQQQELDQSKYIQLDTWTVKDKEDLN